MLSVRISVMGFNLVAPLLERCYHEAKIRHDFCVVDTLQCTMIPIFFDHLAIGAHWGGFWVDVCMIVVVRSILWHNFLS
jgi:hypothetical protein